METSDEWQAVKVTGRRRADAEFLADPANTERFLAAWGTGEDAFLDLDGSHLLGTAASAPNDLDGPRSVIWE